MNDMAIINRLDELITAIKASSIASDKRLWDAETVAAYLGVSVETVRNRYAPRPDFPPALRLPTASQRGTARWQSGDIMEWAEKYREKKRA
jgi:predicted DNA-binding transcriptional regulator AlpA